MDTASTVGEQFFFQHATTLTTDSRRSSRATPGGEDGPERSVSATPRSAAVTSPRPVWRPRGREGPPTGRVDTAWDAARGTTSVGRGGAILRPTAMALHLAADGRRGAAQSRTDRAQGAAARQAARNLFTVMQRERTPRPRPRDRRDPTVGGKLVEDRPGAPVHRTTDLADGPAPPPADPDRCGFRRRHTYRTHTSWGLPFVILERLTTGSSSFHARNCQTLGAAPAQPGGLPRLR